MICRTCGTDIADQAIVCYRCGTATTEPRRQALRTGSGRSDLAAAALALVLLVLAGLYLGQASADDGMPQVVGWILLAGGGGLLGWRWVRRRH